MTDGGQEAKYTRRGASWGDFGQPTSCERVEAEGGSRSVAPCRSRGKWREGGRLQVDTRQEEGRGSNKGRRLRWCLGGRQLTEAVEVGDIR
jgi:hypothetical protein